MPCEFCYLRASRSAFGTEKTLTALFGRHSLLLGLLFSSLDTTIVSTALVPISADLSDFLNAPWVILSDLLTYMGECSRRN